MCGSVWTEEGDLRLIGLLEYWTHTHRSFYSPKLLMNLFINMGIKRGGEDRRNDRSARGAESGIRQPDLTVHW